jgi:hypothetical protein
MGAPSDCQLRAFVDVCHANFPQRDHPAWQVPKCQGHSIGIRVSLLWRFFIFFGFGADRIYHGTAFRKTCMTLLTTAPALLQTSGCCQRHVYIRDLLVAMHSMDALRMHRSFATALIVKLSHVTCREVSSSLSYASKSRLLLVSQTRSIMLSAVSGLGIRRKYLCRVFRKLGIIQYTT